MREKDVDIMGQIILKLIGALILLVGVVLIFFVCVVLVPVIQVYMGSFLFSAYGV